MGVEGVRPAGHLFLLVLAAIGPGSQALGAETAAPGSADPGVRLMSWNIRAAGLDQGPESWERRKTLVVRTILDDAPSVVGLQEVLLGQKEFLDQQLEGYESTGVASMGGKLGEYVPLYHDPVQVEQREAGDIWCSPHPDRPGSIGWGNLLPCQITWGLYATRDTGRAFLVMNAHFAWQSPRCREESARLARRFARSYTERGLPVFLIGDLNASPRSKPYRILADTEGEDPGFHDTWELAARRSGPDCTWNGFQPGVRPGHRIDHIMCHPELTVSSCAVLTNDDQGPYASDHNAVLATVEIPTPLLPERRSQVVVSPAQCPAGRAQARLAVLLRRTRGVRSVRSIDGGGAEIEVATDWVDRADLHQAILDCATDDFF